MQLGPLNDPVDWAGHRCGLPRVKRAEVEAATDALLAYYLADRRTDDELLREVLAEWAEWEELLERARGAELPGRAAGAPRCPRS